MAVGDTHHYILDTILPRHFIQSAAQAIATGQERPPDDFPKSISGSIVGGLRRRLSLMEENLRALALTVHTRESGRKQMLRK